MSICGGTWVLVSLSEIKNLAKESDCDWGWVKKNILTLMIKCAFRFSAYCVKFYVLSAFSFCFSSLRI